MSHTITTFPCLFENKKRATPVNKKFTNVALTYSFHIGTTQTALVPMIPISQLQAL